MEASPAPEPGGPTDRIRVLESFGPPHQQTNPYIVQLYRAMPPSVDALYFSWGRALRGDYDVFHLHWPEIFVRGVTRPKALIRGTLFLLLLLRLRLGRKALVRTLHDRIPHEAPNPLQRVVIALSERWTTLWITLNSESRPPQGAPFVRSEIGHFKDWFAPPDREPQPGRLVHFGLVRRYKGVTRLIRAFAEVPDESLSLHIVGAVQDPILRDEIETLCAADPRVVVTDDYVSDDVLRSEVLDSQLVVLPFSRITNSSSLILALSLDRPVLAPRASSISEVAEEVGPGWVWLYDGELEADDIARALEHVTTALPTVPPDLSRRDWSVIGEDHAGAFAEAVALTRRQLRQKRWISP